VASRKQTVTLLVASQDEVSARMRRALAGEEQGAFISFASVDLLWKVITPKRLDILRALAGSDALSIREVACRVRRDVKAVHGDVRGLVEAGLVEAAPTGSVSGMTRFTWTSRSAPHRAARSGRGFQKKSQTSFSDTRKSAAWTKPKKRRSGMIRVSFAPTKVPRMPTGRTRRGSFGSMALNEFSSQ
jgi:predicted transcriptional regulator